LGAAAALILLCATLVLYAIHMRYLDEEAR
jgi:hypothetical protein